MDLDFTKLPMILSMEFCRWNFISVWQWTLYLKNGINVNRSPPYQGLRPAATTLGRFNSCACSATCYGQCGTRVITRENVMASLLP